MMRRTFIILGAFIGLSLLWLKFSITQVPATKPGETNGAGRMKRLLKPNAIPQRAVKLLSEETNSVTGDPDRGTEMMKLSPEQIAAYLLKYKRNAESLLTAFDECHDKALLKEAAENFPNDPRVQLAVLTQDTADKQLSPEERKLWLDRFKKDSPQNGLPNFIAAMDAFHNGQQDLALAEIKSGNEKAGVSGFNRERIQGLEEMYLAAGLSSVEAKEQASRNLLLPLEVRMRDFAVQLAEMQKNYLAAGDAVSAAQLAALGVNFGQRWTDHNSSPVLISELIGIAMQRIALENLDPNTYYDFLGKTAGERLAELKAQRAEIRPIVADVDRYYPQMTDGDKMIYLDRLKMFGERNAWSWLRQTYGTTEAPAR